MRIYPVTILELTHAERHQNRSAYGSVNGGPPLGAFLAWPQALSSIFQSRLTNVQPLLLPLSLGHSN